MVAPKEEGIKLSNVSLEVHKGQKQELLVEHFAFQVVVVGKFIIIKEGKFITKEVGMFIVNVLRCPFYLGLS
jgi:hypothetical protein